MFWAHVLLNQTVKERETNRGRFETDGCGRILQRCVKGSARVGEITNIEVAKDHWLPTWGEGTDRGMSAQPSFNRSNAVLRLHPPAGIFNQPQVIKWSISVTREAL